jgi:hypothetical protein
MTGVSFIKWGVDESDADEVVLFVEGVDLGFAELMAAVGDRRPKGYQFFDSWVCDQEEVF